MILLTNGYVQDGLKALVYLMPLVYLLWRGKRIKLRFYWLFVAGFGLLFFGHLLDFLDEFAFLHAAFSPEKYGLLQDFFEDFVGCTLGFAFLLAAFFLEYVHRK